MERFRTPYRIVLLLVGLIVLVSMAGAFLLLPASGHLRVHLWKIVLSTAVYIFILYTITRHPGARQLRYLISTLAVLIATVLCYDFHEDLPAICLLHLFPIATAVLFWDMATAIFTAALSTLGHAAAIALTAPLTANLVWDMGFEGTLFFLMAILAGIGVEEWRLRTQQLAVLNAIAQTVSRSLNLDTVLGAALEKVLETLEFESGAVYVKDMETGELEMKQHRGLSEEFRRAVAKGIISAKVADSGKSIIIDDLSQDPKAPRVVVEEGYRPLASIPLLSKGQVQGVLTIASRQLRRFRQQDVDLLLSIGNQIGVAIDNARLYEAEQRRAEELAVLNEIGRAVSSVMHLDDLLELISQEASRLINTSNLYIALYDEKKNEVTFPLYFEEGKRRKPEKRPLRGGITEYVIDSAKPLMINRDLVLHLKELNIELIGKPSKSWLGVPILSEDRAIGVLAIQDYQKENAYDESHLRLLSTIASQAAVAIENARLYEATRQELAERKQAEEALRRSEERFHLLVEHSTDAFFLHDFDGRILDVNRHACESLGYTREELLGLSIQNIEQEFVSGEHLEKWKQMVPGEPITLEGAQKRKDGTTFPVEVRLGVFESGERQLMLGLVRDMTERKQAEEEIRRRSLQRKTIAEVGRTVSAILDMDTLLSRVVHLIAQGFGYYRVHIFQVDQDSGYAVYRAGTGEAALNIAEEGLRLKIGEEGFVGWVAQHGEPVLVNDVSQDPRYYAHPDLPDTRSELEVPIRAGERIIGVLDVQSAELNAFDESDLDTLQTLADQLAVAMENARLYQETKRLAITDGLTGLYNLRYFYEALEKEIQRSERYHRSVSLIILDIDDFKAYNDLYGHLAGDHLLVELAQLMSRVIRQTDTLARYGGEEFAIILPETETEGAGFLAERLQKEVSEYRFSMQDGQTIGRITISLGVATYPHHADSAKALVDAADKALLRAKRAGKNRVSVCEEELTELKPR